MTTIPILSKYEYSAVISKRANEVYKNPISTLSLNKNEVDPIRVAENEFKHKKIPIKLKRKIGNEWEELNVNKLNYFHFLDTEDGYINAIDIENDEDSFDSCDTTDSEEWYSEDELVENERKRKLTSDEIDDILNNIMFIIKKNEYIEYIEKREKQKLTNQLKEIKIYPSKYIQFKEKVLTQFYKTIVPPGESVGVNSAQCIGEPVTQGTLNTFHSCGISKSNVTLGFARASELFNATSNPKKPLSFIYFTKHNKNLNDLHKIMDRIKHINLEDVVDKYSIYADRDFCNTIQWLQFHLDLFNVQPPEPHEWSIHFKLDKYKLYENSIRLKDIKNSLEKEYNDIRIINSPLCISEIVVIVDCSDITASSLNENDDGEINKEMQDIKSDYDARRYYMNSIVALELQSLKINGVFGIQEIIPQKKNKTDYGIPLKPKIMDKLNTSQNKEEWMVECVGSNIEDLFEIPFIDKTRTYTNNFIELYNVYGIECARTFLLFEFTNIVNASGGYINPRHIELLVDKMTHTGIVRAISRNGIDSNQYEPISRASFEEVMKHLIQSASFSEVDHLQGISNNIALGKPIRAGTGHVIANSIPLIKKK